MATSPQDGSQNLEVLTYYASSEPSSNNTSTLLSSDSWQCISHELARNEQSVAPCSAIANAGNLPQWCMSTTFDPVIGHTQVDPDLPGSYPNPVRDILSPNTNAPTMQPLLACDLLPTWQSPWTGSCTLLPDPDAPAVSVPSSLMVHPRKSMETMLLSDQVVVTYDFWGPTTPMTTNDVSSPSMPEVLLGLALKGHDNLDQGHFGTPGKTSNTWICDEKGCTKQFTKQHRYK